MVALELVCTPYELSAALSRRMQLLQLQSAEPTPAAAAILPSEEGEEEETSWVK